MNVYAVYYYNECFQKWMYINIEFFSMRDALNYIKVNNQSYPYTKKYKILKWKHILGVHPEPVLLINIK